MAITSIVRLPSASLQKTVTYSALIPALHEAGPGPFSVLYLLHPYGHDHADWLIKTRLEQYLEDRALLIVMPNLENSLGCDTVSGVSYEQFFLDELMPHIESIYPVKHGPEHTGIAGAGSGGYAALRLALAYPYWFGASASLSGEVHAPQEKRLQELCIGKERTPRYRQVFGDPEDPRRTSCDLFHIAGQLNRETAPALMIDCGQDDDLLPHNREFHRRLTQLRIRHDFTDRPGGHNWSYWDSRLPGLLTFMSKHLNLDETPGYMAELRM